jgi:hypothetical protein
LFPRRPRGPGEGELRPGLLRLLLNHAEVVVVEQPQRLDGVSSCPPGSRSCRSPGRPGRSAGRSR